MASHDPGLLTFAQTLTEPCTHHTHTVFTARGAARGQAEPAHSQVLRPGMQGREQEIK